MAEKTKSREVRVVIDGDSPKTLTLDELPNWALKPLLLSGSDEVWDEVVDRVWRKAERGDYGPPEHGEGTEGTG